MFSIELIGDGVCESKREGHVNGPKGGGGRKKKFLEGGSSTNSWKPSPDAPVACTVRFCIFHLSSASAERVLFFLLARIRFFYPVLLAPRHELTTLLASCLEIIPRAYSCSRARARKHSSWRRRVPGVCFFSPTSSYLNSASYVFLILHLRFVHRLNEPYQNHLWALLFAYDGCFGLSSSSAKCFCFCSDFGISLLVILSINPLTYIYYCPSKPIFKRTLIDRPAVELWKQNVCEIAVANLRVTIFRFLKKRNKKNK